MKLWLPCTGLCVALLACLSVVAQAEDKPIKIDKTTVDKAKDVLDKVLGEARSAADKAGEKGKDLWERTKDSMRLSREEYLKKADSGLKTMEAEIQVLAESGSALNSRDYFKMRIDALKLHLDYCRRDFDRLQASETEEAFRVKQKGFDRGLDFLGENIELALEEAGL